MIVGGGQVGASIARALAASHEVVVVDHDPTVADGMQALDVEFRLGSRTLVLRGDGTDLEFLESENVGQSDVLVSVIDNDERNLLASLLGRQLGIPKIVTRVGRPANLRLFERVGIDVAISGR